MNFIKDFLVLLYPRTCEACNKLLFKHELFICNYCKLNLPKSNYHLLQQTELSDTFAGRVPLINSFAFFLYEKSGKIQRLLHAIKYQNQKELAEFLGNLYANDLLKSNVLNDIDIIIPIPLHKNKLKHRGYNQSEWFAKGLSLGLSKPLDILSLERKIETDTQTRKKKYERWQNVDGIFRVNNQNLINKHVLLVDDVITTGATIESAWVALKEIEGIKISIISIAFAQKKL